MGCFEVGITQNISLPISTSTPQLRRSHVVTAVRSDKAPRLIYASSHSTCSSQRYLQHPVTTPMARLPRKRKRSNVLSHPSRHKLPSCLPIPQGNWRSTITVSLAGTSTVLICNSLLLMSSLVKIQEDIDLPGVRTLYTGSCSLSARYNTIAHFLINIASTIILSSSGYCMVRHLQKSMECLLMGLSNACLLLRELKLIAHTPRANIWILES